MKPESLRRGFVSTVTLNLCLRVITLIQGFITASLLGVSLDMDLYVYVSGTMLLLGAFLRAMNTTVLLPRFYVVESREGRACAVAFFNYFLLCFSGVSLAVAGLAGVAPEWFWSLLSGYPRSLLAAHSGMMGWGAALLPAALVSSFLGDLLTACQYFTKPLLAYLVVSAFPAIFLLADSGRHGATALIAGQTVGMIVRVFILGWWSWRLAGWRPWRAARSAQIGVWGDVGHAQFGNIFSAVTPYVTLYLLRGVGEGALSAFNYAQYLANLPRLYVLDNLLPFVSLKFNQVLAAEDWPALNQIYARALRMLGVVVWPFCFVTLLLRHQVVACLFYFHPLATATGALVADLLACLVFVVPFAAADNFMVGVMSAAKAIRQAMRVQVVANVALIAGFYFLRDYWGAMAFAYVQLAVMVGVMINCLILIRWWLPNFVYTRAVVEFVVMGAPAAAAAGVVALLERHHAPGVVARVVLTLATVGAFQATALWLMPGRGELVREMRAWLPWKRFRGAAG